MTQRKLTTDELEDVLIARQVLRRTTKFASHTIPVCHALDVLDEMAREATTDGKPYVEPEPPIPDGYRLAVAGDEGRRDVKYLCAEDGWTKRSVAGCAFVNHEHYIVPIDRVPTDDDAKSRPEVMVRDWDGQKWHKDILILVRDCDHSKYKFATTDTERAEIVCWKQARHLHPGE